MMPRVDGEVLYNEVVRDFPFLANRFIFVTGQASRKAGFSDLVTRAGNCVIEKPFDLPALRAAVRDTWRAEAIGGRTFLLSARLFGRLRPTFSCELRVDRLDFTRLGELARPMLKGIGVGLGDARRFKEATPP